MDNSNSSKFPDKNSSKLSPSTSIRKIPAGLPSYPLPPKPLSTDTNSSLNYRHGDFNVYAQRDSLHSSPPTPTATAPGMMYHASLNLAIPISSAVISYSNGSEEKLNSSNPDLISDKDTKFTINQTPGQKETPSNNAKYSRLRNDSTVSHTNSVLDAQSETESRTRRSDRNHWAGKRKTVWGHIFFIASYAFTLLIPDSLLKKKWGRKREREAWREKILTVIILLFVNSVFFFLLEWAGYYLCPWNTDIMVEDVSYVGNQCNYSVVQGRIIDAARFDSLVTKSDATKLTNFVGLDSTSLFPTWLNINNAKNNYIGLLDSKIVSNWISDASATDGAQSNYSISNPFSSDTAQVWKCPSPKNYSLPVKCLLQSVDYVTDPLNTAAIGYQVFDKRNISSYRGDCVVVKSKVYNMTRYFRVSLDKSKNFKTTNGFLPDVVSDCLYRFKGSDATKCLEGSVSNDQKFTIPGSKSNLATLSDIIGILDSIFFAGIIEDFAIDLTPCQKVNPVLFIITFIAILPRIIGILTSLVYDSGPGFRYYQKIRSAPVFIPEHSHNHSNFPEQRTMDSSATESWRQERNSIRSEGSQSSTAVVSNGISNLNAVSNPNSISQLNVIPNISLPVVSTFQKAPPIAVTLNVGSSMPFNLYVVPIVNEGVELVRASIESVKRTDYAKDRELLVIICDGPVIENEQDFTNATHGSYLLSRMVLKDVLNHRDSDVPQDPASGNPSFMHTSVGEDAKKYNFARVYSGWCPDSELPYIVIVKRENRGKRDSIWMIMNFLNKVYNMGNSGGPRNSFISGYSNVSVGGRNAPFSALENELHQIMTRRLGIEPREIKYLTVVDGDTIIAPESPGRILRQLEDPIHGNRTAATHGALLPANANTSFFTMIQAYPWLLLHRMTLAKDMALTRSISPANWSGAFTVYRVSFFDGGPCLIHDDVVLWFGRGARINTMHERYLVLLGEDRYLPYIIMRVHWRRRVRFIYHSGAVAWSQMCTTFDTFVRQFRRWHNVHLHLLIETVWGANKRSDQIGFKISALCTVISIFLLPAFSLYFYFLFFKLARSYTNSTDPLYPIYTQPVSETVSSNLPQLTVNSNLFLGRQIFTQSVPLAIIALGGVNIMHMLVLTLKLEFSKVPYILVYMLIGAPLYTFFLPLYSFFTMDEVVWAETTSMPTHLGIVYNIKQNRRRIIRAHGAYAKASKGSNEPVEIDLSEFAVTEVQPAMIRGPDGEPVPSFEITFHRGNSTSKRTKKKDYQQSLSFSNELEKTRTNFFHPSLEQFKLSQINQEQFKSTQPNLVETTKDLQLNIEEDMDTPFIKKSLLRLSKRNNLGELVRNKKLTYPQGMMSSSILNLLNGGSIESVGPELEAGKVNVEELEIKLHVLSRKESKQADHNVQKYQTGSKKQVSRFSTRTQHSFPGLGYKPSSLADQPRIVSGGPSMYAPSQISLISSFGSSMESSSLARRDTRGNFNTRAINEGFDSSVQETNGGFDSSIQEANEGFDSSEEDVTLEDFSEEILLFLEEGLPEKSWNQITKRDVYNHLLLAFGEPAVNKWSNKIDDCMDRFMLGKLSLL